VVLLRQGRGRPGHWKRGRRQALRRPDAVRLSHIGFTIPPQADAYWVGEAGPGPSHLDDERGAQNHWTTRNTVFAAWNMLHTARRLKDHGGLPAHGNVTTNWDLGNPTHPIRSTDECHDRCRVLLGPRVITSAVTGALAGPLMGYMLQRGQLCFHSAIRNSLDGRFLLARGWALGVALASVGLALLFLLPGTIGLNQGLAFRPVANVAGGLIIGIGMVVARSCVSGLFYKLGAGMLGALVGLTGWAGGELLARQLTLPGPTVLSGGEGSTIPACSACRASWSPSFS